MSWKGIFYINIPFGIIAIILALVYLKPDKGRRDLPRFDILGFVLLAGSLTALLWVAELLGKGTGKMTELWPIAVGGLLAFAAYCLHNRRRAHAVIDLSILQFRLFRTNILGAAPLRIAIAANPFLLPLLFQLGFGLSPLTSGLLAAASAVGSLCTRAVVKPALTYLNLKLMLVVSTVLTAFCYASYAFFTETTPHWLIFLTLFIAGLFASLCMVSLNTLGFGSIPDDRKSHAVSLLAMAQQLFAGFGVVTASWLLSLAVRARGGDTTQIFKQDFSAAFVVIGGIAMVSAFVFMRIDSREEEGQTI
jgi:MFS family permease